MLTALRVCALLYGAIALAGSAAVVLFFTLETSMIGLVPTTDLFGPLSDWFGVVAAPPVILAVLLFCAVAAARWWLWILSALVAASFAASAVVTWLFIHGEATLDDQFAASAPQIVLLAAWVVCAGSVGAQRRVLPRWMRAFAVVIVAAFALAALVFAISFAIPAETGGREAVAYLAGIPGFLAYTAQPIWWICLAVTARHRD
ncbi:hypothetical protein GCM10009775_10490 [Microbacterium aoyamense]|uniref:DUF998 domain-containing protein n=1 Tax=Microbacterium aoyamense TaxID=344166 RepID=A0ABN2PEM2_9MICO|nr:hypothetical protein [Microbacterium aoyamense]